MNKDMEAVTFRVEVKAYGKGYYAVAAPDDLDRNGFKAVADNGPRALLNLYELMTYNFCSFRLQVVDNGEVVTEMTYSERH